ncbi:MAG: transcription elongation factor GreA [Candidatus Parcubacteria bacterium]|jgi:transcription elongation factor GreA
MKKYHMTQSGLEKAQVELEALMLRRKEIIEKIKAAKEQGDLKENGEYHEAKNDMAFNESKILELEDLIRNAEVVESPSNSQFVALGSQIKVSNGVGERDFLIVGPTEANPAERKISDESPLGQAFMHRSVGEEVEVETPAGVQKYKILEIK